MLQFLFFDIVLGITLSLQGRSESAADDLNLSVSSLFQELSSSSIENNGSPVRSFDGNREHLLLFPERIFHLFLFEELSMFNVSLKGRMII